MAKNKFQVKRTSVSGRVPNTSDPSNTSYIDTGELAFNLTDVVLYTSNGSSAIEVGSNLSSLAVRAVIANGTVGTPGKVLTSGGDGGNVYWSTVTGGGGLDVDAQYYWTNTQTFSNTITFLSVINATANLALTANNATYLNTKSEGGLNVNSALTANSSTYLGTKQEAGLNVNNALTANSSTYLGAKLEAGLNVNSAASALNANNSTYLNNKTESNLNVNNALTANSSTYLGTKTEGQLNVNSALTSNSTTYINGNTASDLNTYASDKAANAYSNGVTYSSNASNLGNGTVPYARLGGNVVNTTSNFTFTGNHIYSGNVQFNGFFADATGNTGAAGQILTTNGANTYWSSKYTVGSLPPDYPNYGDTWYYTDLEKLLMWVNDGAGDYWYDFLPPAA